MSDENIQRIEPATKRYPEIFDVIDSALGAFHSVIDTGQIEDPTSALQSVRIAFVIRIYNLLKSVRQLLANDHWEHAAILMRSMFELLLNAEEIERDPAKAESAAIQFLKFEKLQRLLKQKAILEYEVKRGVRKQLPAEFVKAEKAAESLFPQWLQHRKDGSMKWDKSWCGKNVRQLCELSSDPFRIGQYDVVYSYTSAIAHGTPIGVIFPQQFGVKDWDEFTDKMDQSEKLDSKTAMSLAVTFSIGVVTTFKFLDGLFNPLRFMLVFRKVYALWGDSPPPVQEQVAAAMAKLEASIG